MNIINCPECDSEILSRLGTICPNCGYTIGYFNGDKKRKEYGKLFAKTVFFPFISFILIIFASLNLYTMIGATFTYLFLAYKSCPFLVKSIFFTKFEKILFISIWTLLNSIISIVIFNIFIKF